MAIFAQIKPHGKTHQIGVSAVVKIEDRRDFTELLKDLIVACHIGSEDAANHPLTHTSKLVH